MKQIDDIKAFFARKRAWPYIIAAIALMIVGQVMARHQMGFGDLARAGTSLTDSIYQTLDRQQPGDMLRRYGEAMYGETPTCAADCGPHNPVSFVFTALKVTPQVAAESWRTGNWFTRILLVVTLGFVALLVWGAATDQRESLGQRIVLLPFALAIGAAFIALVFWLALIVLMLITKLVGDVLSGLVFVIGTFGGAWQIGKLAVETLKHADKLEDEGAPLVKKLFGIGTTTPAVPPKLPPEV